MAQATAFLELNLTQFDRAIASAQRSIAVLAASFASFKSVQFLTNQTKEAINFADSLWKVSQTMGKMDTGSLLLSQKALEQIGYSAEAARTRIQELVGAGIPLSVAFGGAKNYADAITRASEQFGGTATILSRAGDRFALVWDRLQAAAGKFREFFLGMAEQFLRPLQVLLDRMIAMDFGGLGARIGDAVAKAVNVLNGALESGTLGELIEAGFAVGAAYLDDAFNHLTEIAGAVGIAIGVAFLGVLESAGGLKRIFAEIGSVISRVLITAMEVVVRAIHGALFGVFEGLISIFRTLGLGKKGDTFAKDVEAFNQVQKSLGEGFGKARERASALPAGVGLAANIPGIMADTSKLIGDTLKEGFKNVRSPETEARLLKLSEIMGNAQKRGEELAAGAQGKPGSPGVGKADPFRVIADSLARVGGGGGFIQVGQTLEAKLLIQNNRYAAQTAENTAVTAAAARKTNWRAPLLTNQL